MKKRLFSAILIVFIMAMGGNDLAAQIKLPPASSPQTITQGLGISELTLTYNRPSARGRKIFGALVPYGEVWRTGANNVSTLTFNGEVEIADQTVPAGTYGLFTIPNTDEWIIILSKNSQQWGAYNYKQEEDLLRFAVKPRQLSAPVETFTIDFSDVTPNKVTLNVSWENTAVGFDIVVDQDEEIMASIDEAMKGEKKPYFQAAQYYYNNNKDINKALEWAMAADEGNTRAPHVKYWKARIQLKAGDKQGAITTAKEGIEIAKAGNNEEYVILNSQVIEEAQ